MSWFWVIHSHFREGHMWLNAMLERPIVTMPAARAKVLRAAGMLAENHGDFVRAITLLEESLALYRDLDDPVGAAQALLFLGRMRVWQGAYAQAHALLSESLALSRAQQNTQNTSMSPIWSLLSLGDVAFYKAELLQAREYFQQALALCSDLRDLFASAWALANLGRVAYALGEELPAQTYFAESLALFRQLGNRHDIAQVYLELGRLARSQGNAAQARVFYAESLTVFGEVMDKRGTPVCLEGIAGLVTAVGQHPEGTRRAARLFGAAAAWRGAAGLPLPPVYRAAYERDLAVARAQLDEATWATAWAEGRALLPEQAVAEAQQALLEAEATVL
jgi:tetratricopeptide (TPR) repeat protein